MYQIIILINSIAYGFISLILSIAYLLIGIGMMGEFIEERYSYSYHTPRGLRKGIHRLAILIVGLAVVLLWPLVILWNFFAG